MHASSAELGRWARFSGQAAESQVPLRLPRGACLVQETWSATECQETRRVSWSMGAGKGSASLAIAHYREDTITRKTQETGPRTVEEREPSTPRWEGPRCRHHGDTGSSLQGSKTTMLPSVVPPGVCTQRTRMSMSLQHRAQGPGNRDCPSATRRRLGKDSVALAAMEGSSP